MAENSKIEWTDVTKNPVAGYTKVSPGCKHRSLETFAMHWREEQSHLCEFRYYFHFVSRCLRTTT